MPSSRLLTSSERVEQDAQRLEVGLASLRRRQPESAMIRKRDVGSQDGGQAIEVEAAEHRPHQRQRPRHLIPGRTLRQRLGIALVQAGDGVAEAIGGEGLLPADQPTRVGLEDAERFALVLSDVEPTSCGSGRAHPAREEHQRIAERGERPVGVLRIARSQQAANRFDRSLAIPRGSGPMIELVVGVAEQDQRFVVSAREPGIERSNRRGRRVQPQRARCRLRLRSARRCRRGHRTLARRAARARRAASRPSPPTARWRGAPRRRPRRRGRRRAAPRRARGARRRGRAARRSPAAIATAACASSTAAACSPRRASASARTPRQAIAAWRSSPASASLSWLERLGLGDPALREQRARRAAPRRAPRRCRARDRAGLRRRRAARARPRRRRPRADRCARRRRRPRTGGARCRAPRPSCATRRSCAAPRRCGRAALRARPDTRARPPRPRARPA